MRGYGTRLVWNSLRSTLREPSKRSEAVIDETTANGVRDILRRLEYQLTLSNQTVQVLIVRALDAETLAADVVDGLVVDHEAAVGVFEGGVGCQDGVVRLNHRSRNGRRRVDAEFQLALLAVVHREALHQKGAETRARATAEGVEDEEALEASAAVGNAADLVENRINELFAHSVMASSIVVGGILLARDHLLRVKKTAVGARANFIDDVRLKVAVDGAGHILAIACRD